MEAAIATVGVVASLYTLFGRKRQTEPFLTPLCGHVFLATPEQLADQPKKYDGKIVAVEGSVSTLRAQPLRSYSGEKVTFSVLQVIDDDGVPTGEYKGVSRSLNRLLEFWWPFSSSVTSSSTSVAYTNNARQPTLSMAHKPIIQNEDTKMVLRGSSNSNAKVAIPKISLAERDLLLNSMSTGSGQLSEFYPSGGALDYQLMRLFPIDYAPLSARQWCIPLHTQASLVGRLVYKRSKSGVEMEITPVKGRLLFSTKHRARDLLCTVQDDTSGRWSLATIVLTGVAFTAVVATAYGGWRYFEMYKRELEWRRQWKQQRRERAQRRKEEQAVRPPPGLNGVASAAQPQQQPSRSKDCVVCMDNEPNAVFLGCHHLCVCVDCADLLRVKRCPLCRVESEVIHVFRS